MTPTTRTRKPAAKPTRHVHLYGADSNPMLIEITIGKELFAYLVKRLHADYGVGFEFRKQPNCIEQGGEEIYHVHYDPATKRSTCDCKGGLHAGHCKHQESIVALIATGKLPLPASTPTAKAEAPKQAEAAPAPQTTKKQPYCKKCNDRPYGCTYCTL